MPFGMQRSMEDVSNEAGHNIIYDLELKPFLFISVSLDVTYLVMSLGEDLMLQGYL